jgi:hypothetical protein
MVELGWVVDRAGEHFEHERAARYLRKFYPWYLERLKEIDSDFYTRARLNEINRELQQTSTLEAAHAVIAAIPQPIAA